MYEVFLILVFTLGPICVSGLSNGDPRLGNTPTKGEVWPKPYKQIKSYKYYILKNANVYNVKQPYYTCDIVDKAVKRLLYGNLMNKFKFIAEKPNENNEIDTESENKVFYTGIHHTKTVFKIELTEKCEEFPHFNMDEKYKLVVDDSIALYSASVWGIIRGLETYSQLLYFSDDFSEIRINATFIEDFPAYKHRGLLIDTGRHYLSTNVISRLIDSMEMNKLNVLHWHIVDDQSFPYQSETFPALSKKGAFHPSMVYTKRNIKRLIKQARLAGIRIIPEFDIPGHVHSWGKAYPEILTKCYEKGIVAGLGPLNPTLEQTYEFLEKLYREVNNVFPDKYIHYGGDEVDRKCWISYWRHNNLTKAKKKGPKSLFYKTFMSIVSSEVQPIFWQDVFDMHVKLPPKTILQVWKYDSVIEMGKILTANHRVLFSSSWYLDILEQDFNDFYAADPRQMLYRECLKQNMTPTSEEELQNIVGGEACMWGEMADETNIFTKVWPKTAAVAERLWTGVNFTMEYNSNVTVEVARRIEEHVCRMRQAGVPVAPALRPGFCLDKPSMVHGSA